MEITLSPEALRIIQERLSAGDFQTPDQVIEAGLRSLSLDAEFEFAPGELDALVHEEQRRTQARDMISGGAVFAHSQPRPAARRSKPS